MNKDQDIRKFIATIRRAFPDAAIKTDEIMRDRGFTSDEGAEYLWIEAFADVTNGYGLQRNGKEVAELLTFISKQFNCGSDAVKNCIDVSYVENLMWNLDSEANKWFWPKIPENLKKVYIAMWGEPTF